MLEKCCIVDDLRILYKPEGYQGLLCYEKCKWDLAQNFTKTMEKVEISYFWHKEGGSAS